VLAHSVATQTCFERPEVEARQPAATEGPGAPVARRLVTLAELDDKLAAASSAIGGLVANVQRETLRRFELVPAMVSNQLEQPLSAVLEHVRKTSEGAAAASAAVAQKLDVFELRLEGLAEELAARPVAVSSPVGPDPLRPEPFDLGDAPLSGEEVFDRLYGLTNERYNLRPVRIWDAPGGRDRVPVQLADSGECIKVKPANIGVYHPAKQDACCRCGGHLNLPASPPCECSPSSALAPAAAPGSSSAAAATTSTSPLSPPRAVDRAPGAP